MKRGAMLAVVVVFLTVFAREVEIAIGEDGASEYHGKLSSLPAFDKALGDGWHGPSGLTIDNIADLSTLDAPMREIAKQVAEQMIPIGVTAFSDFSYTRRDVPRIVTVRVFVFKDTQSAKAWWKTKYKHPGWERFYEVVTGLGDVAVKSKELPKTMTLKGNVWLTSHQLHEGNEYNRALKHYLKHVSIKPLAGDAP